MNVSDHKNLLEQEERECLAEAEGLKVRRRGTTFRPALRQPTIQQTTKTRI
jgi:hypothetical protein